MLAVRGHVVRSALLAVAVFGFGGFCGFGCRGEAREREEEAKAKPPADEKLAWPAIDEPSLIALIATEGYQLGTPIPLAITPDGAVLFRRSPARDPSADLYQLDPAGKTTTLATAAALLGTAPIADAERARAARGIEAIEVSDDGTRVLIPLAGRLFVIERATGASRELVIGAHRDPHLSPDGKQVAFVRDGDLWVAPVGAPGQAQPTRLTQHPPDREYATAEVVAPELGRRRGYWWSPDSQSIVFQRTDARAVETLYLGDARHPEQAPAAVKLPRSGKANAVVDLGIVSVRGGAARWVTWELARFPYLARVIWPAKGLLTLVVVDREQTQIAVLTVDPTTLATRSLFVDKDPAWINVAPDPLRWLPDGSGFLWMSETTGAWALEHYAADGTHVGAAVTADVGLRRIVGLSPDGHDLIIEATIDPREQHVLRVPLPGSSPAAPAAPAAPANPTELTSGGGVHSARSGYGVLVITSAHRAGGRVVTVIRADGSRVELPSVAEHPKLAPTTKFEAVTLDDHIQDAAVTRPHNLEPKVRYPVLLRLDGEPGSKALLDASDTYLLDQWYADAGFIVVRTDGRGTRGHDRLWERAIAGDMLTLPMNDQIGALKQLGAHFPELDRGRLGVVGAGFGGFLAALAVLLHPDVFAAAIAVSPITDWELLPTAYAERYMKAPAMNGEGYRRTNASVYAEQLKRPLMILAGVTDERIHFAHTLALLEALHAAGKHVEVGTLPANPDVKVDLARTKLELEFLREHLGPPVRPQVMPAPRDDDEEEEEERERAKARPAGNKDRGDKDRGDKDHEDKDHEDKDRH